MKITMSRSVLSKRFIGVCVYMKLRLSVTRVWVIITNKYYSSIYLYYNKDNSQPTMTRYAVYTTTVIVLLFVKQATADICEVCDCMTISGGFTGIQCRFSTKASVHVELDNIQWPTGNTTQLWANFNELNYNYVPKWVLYIYKYLTKYSYELFTMHLGFLALQRLLQSIWIIILSTQFRGIHSSSVAIWSKCRWSTIQYINCPLVSVLFQLIMVTWKCFLICVNLILRRFSEVTSSLEVFKLVDELLIAIWERLSCTSSGTDNNRPKLQRVNHFLNRGTIIDYIVWILHIHTFFRWFIVTYRIAFG